MGIELITRQEENTRETISENQARIVGGTVIEALAIDAETAIEAGGTEDIVFTNSLTRRPGGQTVPDER